MEVTQLIIYHICISLAVRFQTDFCNLSKQNQLSKETQYSNLIWEADFQGSSFVFETGCFPPILAWLNIQSHFSHFYIKYSKQSTFLKFLTQVL